MSSWLIVHVTYTCTQLHHTCTWLHHTYASTFQSHARACYRELITSFTQLGSVHKLLNERTGIITFIARNTNCLPVDYSQWQRRENLYRETLDREYSCSIAKFTSNRTHKSSFTWYILCQSEQLRCEMISAKYTLSRTGVPEAYKIL